MPSRFLLLAAAIASASCAASLAPIDPTDAGGDAAADAAPDSSVIAPSTVTGGSVYALAFDQQTQGDAQFAITHYGAVLAENAPADDAFDCPAVAVRGCKLYYCAVPTAADSLRHVSAGTLHLRSPDHTYDTAPSTTHEYGESLDPFEQQWTAGARFEVRADGDPQGIPAFAANIDLPQRVEMLDPAGFDVNHPLFIAPHADLPFHWTPAGTGEFMAEAGASANGGNTFVALVCRVSVDAATLTMPSEGLDAVFGDPHTNGGIIEIWRLTKTVALETPWHVEVRGLRQIASGGLRRR